MVRRRRNGNVKQMQKNRSVYDDKKGGVRVTSIPSILDTYRNWNGKLTEERKNDGWLWRMIALESRARFLRLWYSNLDVLVLLVKRGSVLNNIKNCYESPSLRDKSRHWCLWFVVVVPEDVHGGRFQRVLKHLRFFVDPLLNLLETSKLQY